MKGKIGKSIAPVSSLTLFRAVSVQTNHCVDKLTCVISAAIRLLVETANGSGASVSCSRPINALTRLEIEGVSPEILVEKIVDGFAAIGSVEVGTHLLRIGAIGC